MFTIGSDARLQRTGRRLVATEQIGEGAQGAVFRVRADDGAELALKWYHPHASSDSQRSALERLVQLPAPDDRFLWPIEIASRDGDDGFGYAMRLLPEGFSGLVDRVAGRVDLSFRVIATIGFALADAFLDLHSQGLCYRDVSFGNVFFEPVTGSVLICDNDNVAFDGEGEASVLGTPYFMAPEIVRGEALPSARTDRFSLAVLLFYLLMIHHPLEGARAERMWDSDAMLDLFGREPLFIFDSSDTSNAPVPGLHDTPLLLWHLYPQQIRDLFTQSFTVGLRDPVDGRVPESVWRSAMIALRDSIAYCTNCGKQNPTDAGGGAPSCWSCQEQLVMPPRLLLNRHAVVLNHDARVYRHHIALDYDFSQTVAEVAQHPSDPSVWGLRNVSADTWVVTSATGERHDVVPGRSVTLAPGTEIVFTAGIAEAGRIVA